MSNELTFVNFRQFQEDILVWERQLPEVDAFIGVPRSGLIPASILALRRNVRLVPLGLFLKDPKTAVEKSPMRSNNPAMGSRPKKLQGRVMIVDDCCSDNASTMTSLHEHLKDADIDITYGAVYRASATPMLDVYCREIPKPRLFEWNFIRHSMMHNAMWDLDGAICQDWDPVRGDEEVADPKVYLDHIDNAKPLYIPERPIYAVCTNRLLKWQNRSAKWLKKHNVKYTHMLMSPYATPKERTAMDKPRGSHKGRLYRETETAELFVESCPKQAKVIANIAKKPVLATDTMELFTGK